MNSLLTDVSGPSPEREARFFFGLFLRGNSVQSLREDIDISPEIVSYWRLMINHDPWYREALEVMLPFRKKVLVIFDSLILSSRSDPNMHVR